MEWSLVVFHFFFILFKPSVAVLRPKGAPNPATSSAALSSSTGSNEPPPSTSDSSWRNPRGTHGIGSAALLAPPLYRVSFTQGSSGGNNRGGANGDTNIDGNNGDGDIDLDGTGTGGGSEFENSYWKSDGALGAVGPGGAGPLQCVARVFAAAEAAASAAAARTSAMTVTGGGRNGAPCIGGMGDDRRRARNDYERSGVDTARSSSTTTTSSTTSSRNHQMRLPSPQQPVSELGLALRTMGKRPGLPGVRYSALEVMVVMVVTGLRSSSGTFLAILVCFCSFSAMLLSLRFIAIQFCLRCPFSDFFQLLCCPSLLVGFVFSILPFSDLIFSALPGLRRRSCHLVATTRVVVVVSSWAVHRACC